jgi:cation diffusion facilitator CzcD-associated flavoprotein CzcO
VSRTRVAIIGSGFAGLAMAAKLREAGIDDFVVLERADAIGGTWRENTYPGCACDVPAHLYSFSFAPNPGWSRAFAPQTEIRAYLERVATSLDLRRHVRFGCEVVSAAYDEAAATWSLRCADGRVFVADVAIAATGPLTRPAIPSLPGLERFRGRTWHSAQWEHGYPLRGKRVAVIGTGASAIQLVPAIVPEVASLHLFQRTPAWVLPRPDHVFSDLQRRLFEIEPVRWLYRQRLYWSHELRAIPFTLAPGILRVAQRLAVRHLERHIADPALRARLTPDYVMGCKRILMSNDYYPALAQPHVEVVADGVAAVEERGLRGRDGVLREVDAIIFGTGFDVHDYLGKLRVYGRERELGALWKERAEAYHGVAVPGFPNLFVLLGPNTGLGHNSMIVMIEAQVRYVISCLRRMDRARAASIEVRPDVTESYNAGIQARLVRTVWMTGCKSWYRNADGKNTTLWPGATAEFVARTFRARDRDFVLRRREELPAALRRTA